jgi:8-oxo-dGTP pyrophosphatase MutT (NUDIX family)
MTPRAPTRPASWPGSERVTPPDAVTPPAHEPLADEPFEVPVVARERVLDGMVWDVVRERFALGDHEVVREFVDHTGAVAVLAVDDDERVLLIRQYRHPIRAREWELPAGLLDIPGEDPLVAAQRELAEEVDLEAAHWESLVDFHTTPGGSNERLRVFLARGLTATDGAFARTEEEADIEIRWTSLDEVVEAALAGRIGNAILIVGALAAHARRG